jgi:transcription elongation factor
MSRRRGQIRATRSSNEYGGKTVYYCTGGAGTRAAAEAARTGLTWLPDGGHGPVSVEQGGGPALLRCPVCGLTKPVNYKRRRAIRDAGLTEVDISALPF